MAQLQKVFFQPWIGDRYCKSSYGRLLVLGESHHGSDPTPDFTVCVIKEYIANKVSKSWFRTFTNIGLTVAGTGYRQVGRSEFWNSVAFYNYVQELVSGPGVAPTTEMFARSERAFFEVISALTPTHILALGCRLWNEMPSFESECPPLQVGDKASDCGRYASIDMKHHALAIRIHHPAWAFSSKGWHPLVSEFLQLTP